MAASSLAVSTCAARAAGPWSWLVPAGMGCQAAPQLQGCLPMHPPQLPTSCRAAPRLQVVCGVHTILGARLGDAGCAGRCSRRRAGGRQQPQQGQRHLEQRGRGAPRGLCAADVCQPHGGFQRAPAAAEAPGPQRSGELLQPAPCRYSSTIQHASEARPALPRRSSTRWRCSSRSGLWQCCCWRCCTCCWRACSSAGGSQASTCPAYGEGRRLAEATLSHSCNS
jgi:hypothetical protein